jgi:hypothetical protein
MVKVKYIVFGNSPKIRRFTPKIPLSLPRNEAGRRYLQPYEKKAKILNFEELQKCA